MPAFDGTRFQVSSRVSPDFIAPASHVLTEAVSPPLGPSLRIQTGRAALASSEPRSCWPKATCASAATRPLVWTVTATVGSVCWSALRTFSLSCTLPAMCWTRGNEASTISTLNSPDGSSASWRAPPPQPTMANVSTISARFTERNVPPLVTLASQ